MSGPKMIVPPVAIVLTGLPETPVNGNYRVVTNVNGTFLQLWNPTQSLWHSLFVMGASGSETFALGPGEP